MPKKYSSEAHEYCRELYLKYGGGSHQLIERDMRKAGWAGWRRENLYDKGYGEHERLGWITRFGYERSLKIHTEQLVEKVLDDVQDLYVGIKNVRKSLQEKVDAGTAGKDEIYQYRDFCKLEIEARKNLNLTEDNFETFVAGFEKLCGWLGEIDAKAAERLIANGEQLTQMAAAHYGKQPDEIDSRAGNGANEGGDEPFSLIDR
ncbi:MAG: hypothetical protein IPM50_02675 [Acidobacteriota bacterium]|nr:MAG: hypothetical protein IPM50_02675 [Acidobacteriota bacterium]